MPSSSPSGFAECGTLGRLKKVRRGSADDERSGFSKVTDVKKPPGGGLMGLFTP